MATQNVFNSLLWNAMRCSSSSNSLSFVPNITSGSISQAGRCYCWENCSWDEQ